MGAKKLGRLRLSLKRDGYGTEEKADHEVANVTDLDNGNVEKANEEEEPSCSKNFLHEREGKAEESNDEACTSYPRLSGENMAEIEVNLEKISHAVEWLRNNFCVFETGSVARCELHEQYSEYSRRVFQEEPMNMASLGKHVRALFPDVITRRLGHRGNSR